MNRAIEYLAFIKSLLIAQRCIVGFTIVREEDRITKGMYRYRVVLKDDSLLEMAEYFEMVGNSAYSSKYSFHWQDKDGTLRRRWDNAPHHPELGTFPHHVHEGSENVLPHQAVTVEDVLNMVCAGCSGKSK